jgi:hypothetical protein
MLRYRHQARREILSFFILDWSLVRLMPRRAAAPEAPQSPHGLPAAPAGIEGLLITCPGVGGGLQTAQCCVSAQGFSLHAEVWLGGLACLTTRLTQQYSFCRRKRAFKIPIPYTSTFQHADEVSSVSLRHILIKPKPGRCVTFLFSCFSYLQAFFRT